MPEELTACRRCTSHYTYCSLSNGTTHHCSHKEIAFRERFNFLAGRYEKVRFVVDCCDVNTDGHCPHFSQRTPKGPPDAH